VRRDRGGAWLVSGLMNIGLGGTQITEPDASFFSVAGQVQRVQVVSPNVFLVGVLEFQLAADPLLPSQQFVIGGGQSVRGYRQNVRSGDNGVRASLESRITVVREGGSQRPIFQVAPFVEVGGIWNHPGIRIRCQARILLPG
jgi:hemolysin activation/secretion protein